MRDQSSPPLTLPEGVIGQSPALLHTYDLAAEASLTERHVLIRGPSGSGKTALATFIATRTGLRHLRKSCANLRGALLAAELFGYVKGAFTGAIRPYEGLLAQADGGVLILDEIGKASLDLQERLLTLVEDGLYTPLGSQESRRARVRIIAMTSNDLEALVSQGRFLQDLLARLETITLHLPGLAARGDDVVLIAEHILATNAYLKRRGQRSLDDSARRWLMSITFPNEVRGLEKLLFQTVMLHRDALCLTEKHLEHAHLLTRRGALGPTSAPPPAQARAETVLEHLSKRGPCTAAELRDATGTPKSTLGRWLRTWVPDRVVKLSGYPPRYYLRSQENVEGQLPAPLDELEVTALRLAGNAPLGVASRQLVQVHHVSSDTARRRLVDLCRLGLLQPTGKGRARRYVLTAEGSRLARDEASTAEAS